MADEMQYDSSLGGDQTLPHRVNVLKFTADRAKEIQAMRTALQSSTGTKLIFQRLPKHMRRRVMSHNAKRLPRRLREIHLNQLKKSGMPPKQKRPSRKYRRRPRNLLDDYARRQRQHKWLETHIWHAKRFHMIEKWGFRLADKPCDKAFRACYRATTKHCLVQDMSYFSCIQIDGPSEVLLNGFRTICDCSIGLSIGAKAYISGNKEGQVMLFHNSKGIKKAVGTVYFQWKPINELNTIPPRTLWMWVHAAYYCEVLQALKECFDLRDSEDNSEIYVNDIAKVRLTELRYELNRFRLTGPLSLAVLCNTLKTVPVRNNSMWFNDYIKNTENLETFTKQCEHWKSLENLSSPAELSPHLIICLTVTDPRFYLPRTKTKAVLQWHCVSNVEVPINVAFGPIWESDLRKSLKESKISNAKINQLRSELLVPGTELEETGEAVPVMLIQRPGDRKHCLGYGSGWDLVVPSGWGNTFWLSLIMWGGRAGGLREFDSVIFESGQPPFLAPDTLAGVKEEQSITEAYTNRFFSLPPNKRPNYTKYGIIEPFSFNWKTLIQDWNPRPVDDFLVLRERKTLLNIQNILTKKTTHVEKLNSDCLLNYLVPVRIKLEHKGTVKRFARIYLAEPADLITKNAPVEPIREDKNQIIRKEMRQVHKNLLKRLRRRRVRAKQNDKTIPKDTELLQKYSEQMKKLWLPSLDQSIRTACSRQTIGLVTSGDFSFIKAHSCGVGYITMGAIEALLSKQQKSKVLVRNIACSQYRVATLEIIT